LEAVIREVFVMKFHLGLRINLFEKRSIMSVC